MALDDFDQLTENQINVGLRVGTELDADLANRPRGVVAHRNVLGVKVVAENRKKVSDVWMNMLETGFGEVTEEGK